ncbi:MAG TPA: hypothetical protein PLW68_06405 [Casimicrobiaceae bacterium]|nr:hypothetical protein [Casimicrobiaceae bacterium]
MPTLEYSPHPLKHNKSPVKSGMGDRTADRRAVGNPGGTGAIHAEEGAGGIVTTAREFSSPIQGQLLRLTERREVAIFLHEGALWVADFIDGNGELIDAVTWFRFHCAAIATSQARHRMVLESAVPLSEELVAKIEMLQRT